MSKKWVYHFSTTLNEGSADMRDVLGGKGANLAEMCGLGIPVPPGFTISTEASQAFLHDNKQIPSGLQEQITGHLGYLEDELSLSFGNREKPLLLSVRSGAPISMPGMMDTILNLGLNDSTVEGLAKSTDNRRFALDSYRRFIQMYSDVVLKLQISEFERQFHNIKLRYNETADSAITEQTLEEVIAVYKDLVIQHTGHEFPQDIRTQLWQAIKAVFLSWNSNRAKKYRLIHNMGDNMGTAVNIQSMVFGNKSNNSATGVAFTRNPATGENKFYGEFLLKAQGEDVVAGIRTPYQITENGKESMQYSNPSLEELMPELYQELYNIARKLELHYRDVQDIEFTIEEGKLWILQTRTAKRTAFAALRIAMELLQESMINAEEVIQRIGATHLRDLLHPTLHLNSNQEVLTKGLPASPGAASGLVALSSSQAIQSVENAPVILVRDETSPEDIEGMNAAHGILTIKGGMTSHAAVVARGMGKPCVTSAPNMQIDYRNNSVYIGAHTIKEGEFITINGATGEVIAGQAEMHRPEAGEYLQQILQISDKYRRLKVRVNAETQADLKTAKAFGCEGIGLCRTEHMFFQNDRINLMRRMILAGTQEEREEILAKLAGFQQEDFKAIFRLLRELPITIRLLDPPLHEFLPSHPEDIRSLANTLGIDYGTLSARINELHETNPMLGHRGCRLGITFPEIYNMQIECILSAAKELDKNHVEIMVPLIMEEKELLYIKDCADKIAEKLEYKNFAFGTMIELPRAALKADKIAKHVDFISFGTNDLTQTTLGLSRDDSQKFLDEYVRKSIINFNPFESLDQTGVGELIKIAIAKARQTNPDIKLGICGEHGGDEASIRFFEQQELAYVSCSPYRIPGARIAAAKAALSGLK